MITARIGVFETNSSSAHSININMDATQFDKSFDEENGVIIISPGEFGWEEETYYSAYTKASYALTWAKNYGTDADERLLQTVLEEVLRKPIEFRSYGSGWDEWGYIDHQSDDVCKEAFENEVKLKMFIFNPASVLNTDNDNH